MGYHTLKVLQIHFNEGFRKRYYAFLQLYSLQFRSLQFCKLNFEIYLFQENGKKVDPHLEETLLKNKTDDPSVQAA